MIVLHLGTSGFETEFDFILNALPYGVLKGPSTGTMTVDGVVKSGRTYITALSSAPVLERTG